MNRQEIRARVMDWWYDSRLGWIGPATDLIAWAGCRYAGHQPHDADPGLCRYCAAVLPHHRVHTAVDHQSKTLWLFCSCRQAQDFPYETGDGRNLAEAVARRAGERHAQNPGGYPLGSELKSSGGRR